MTHRVFIDGQAGTTGLEIHARLREQPDLELLEIDPLRRKDPAARREILNAADAVILCLPDEAAREAVSLVSSPRVRVIDASTAHRTAEDWIYGLPELCTSQRDAIASGSRIANPGCYPTGFLLLVRPLVDAGIIDSDVGLTVHALSGYTGGGRAMIERYEALGDSGPEAMLAPRAYGLSLEHKHLGEMQRFAGLRTAPLFAPMVGHYARGMLVHVPLTAKQCARRCSTDEIVEVLRARYADETCVHVHAAGAAEALVDGGFLDPEACNHSNRVELMVFGEGERRLLVARLDNLGKGAAGAAVQNLNLVLGRPELEGIRIDGHEHEPSTTVAASPSAPRQQANTQR